MFTRRSVGSGLYERQDPAISAPAGGRKNLEDVDREVARLATLCKVRLLDAGVIERVLNNDESVCGTSNKAAFDKLRSASMMHYHVRGKAVGAIGEAATAEVIAEIVANIRKRLGKQLGGDTSGLAHALPRLSEPRKVRHEYRQQTGAKPRHRDQGVPVCSASARSSRASSSRSDWPRPPTTTASATPRPARRRAPGSWTDWYSYAVDAAQRSILFWDTIRQRGNNFVEHTQAGLPPVLHFDYETVVDGRKLARPVNYALVRIVPPEGVTVDPKRRPYIIIDPRAGPRPRHRRLQGRLAGGRRAARGPSGLLRHLLPRSRARADAARRVRGGEAVRAQGARSCIRRARSPRSSATARAAGRR